MGPADEPRGQDETGDEEQDVQQVFEGGRHDRAETLGGALRGDVAQYPQDPLPGEVGGEDDADRRDAVADDDIVGGRGRAAAEAHPAKVSPARERGRLAGLSVPQAARRR